MPKAYGVIFTDVVMREVHIEPAFGYDTGSFLFALSKLTSVRGSPELNYSNLGSQLFGAGKELKEAWKSILRKSLHRKEVENGLIWIFGLLTIHGTKAQLNRK